MIAFACSGCRTKLSVKDELAGKKGKCPTCNRPIVVPAPTAPRPQIAPPDANATVALMQTPATDPLATQGVAPAEPVHDAGLTDFLAPAQSGDELGRLGKYRVLGILGHGGMGVVYKAEDPKLKRLVALKAMLPNLAGNASIGRRFLREAQAMAAVEHDHIVRIYQVDEEGGVPFLAMELLKGESLEDRLERDGRMPLPEAVRVGREVAEALAAAHETGLIHRDVKPANVWLEAPKNRVKILDFGLARATSQDVGLTQEGAIIGTPAYMAPEQGRGQAVDARSDLFSLGCVLYQIVLGIPPFKGKDVVSTLQQVSSHEPLPPARLDPSVPRELSDVVMKLLEKDPTRRPESAASVAEVLQRVEDRNRPAGTPDRKAGRGRMALVVAAGLLALLAVGCYLAIFFRA